MGVAGHLYGVALEKITVLVHPQSWVHSLVQFTDGSQLAQLGTPDMRIPIAACLFWPRCVDTGVPPLDLVKAGTLQFFAPDDEAFPALKLARRALRDRGDDSLALEREVTILTERMSRLDLKTRELVKQLTRAGVDEC